MHYRETETNLFKEVKHLTKEVDSLKKIIEEKNNRSKTNSVSFNSNISTKNKSWK